MGNDSYSHQSSNIVHIMLGFAFMLPMLLPCFMFAQKDKPESANQDHSNNQAQQQAAPVHRPSPYDHVRYPYSMFNALDDNEDYIDPFTYTRYRPNFQAGRILERDWWHEGIDTDFQETYRPRPVKYFEEWDFDAMEGAHSLTEEEFLTFEIPIVYKVTYDHRNELKRIDEMVMGQRRNVYKYEDPRYYVITGYEKLGELGDYEIIMDFKHDEYGRIIRKAKFEWGKLTDHARFEYDGDRIVQKSYYSNPTQPGWLPAYNTYMDLLGIPRLDLNEHYTCRKITYDDRENPAEVDYYIHVALQYRHGEITIMEEGDMIRSDRLRFRSGRAISKKIYFWIYEEEAPKDWELLKYWKREDDGAIHYYSATDTVLNWEDFMAISPPMLPGIIETQEPMYLESDIHTNEASEEDEEADETQVSPDEFESNAEVSPNLTAPEEDPGSLTEPEDPFAPLLEGAEDPFNF